MRSISRTHPATLAAQHDLQQALLARGQTASGRSSSRPPSAYLAAASDLGGQHGTRRGQAAASKRHRPRHALRNAAAAPQARAAASGSTSGRGSLGSSARRSPRSQATSRRTPCAACARIIRDNATGDGHVTVEFTLSIPMAARPTSWSSQASPRGMFDQAAIKAVAQGRFDPRALTDGLPHRARIRLGFKSMMAHRHGQTHVTLHDAARSANPGQWLQIAATILFAATLTVVLIIGIRRADELQSASSALQLSAQLSSSPQIVFSELTLIQRGLETTTYVGDSLRAIATARQRNDTTYEQLQGDLRRARPRSIRRRSPRRSPRRCSRWRPAASAARRAQPPLAAWSCTSTPPRARSYRRPASR